MLYVSIGIGRVLVTYCGGFLPKIHIHLPLASHTNEVTSCLRGGKPSNPALITAVRYRNPVGQPLYYYSRILRVIFFFFPPLLLRLFSSPIYNKRDRPLVVLLLTRPSSRVRVAVRLRSTVSRYPPRPVYVRALYFVQRYLPGLI